MRFRAGIGRLVRSVVLLCLMLLVAEPSAPASGTTAGQLRYRAPVPGAAVLNPFVAPLDRFAPGHRGVDLAASPRARVLAAADGVVRFVGVVAGRGVIVLLHPDGISTEYEPVRALVRRGEAVRGGQAIGNIDGSHPRCSSTCLHWGARTDATYLDPMALLEPLGPVRLLPWDGPVP